MPKRKKSRLTYRKGRDARGQNRVKDKKNLNLSKTENTDSFQPTNTSEDALLEPLKEKEKGKLIENVTVSQVQEEITQEIEELSEKGENEELIIEVEENIAEVDGIIEIEEENIVEDCAQPITDPNGTRKVELSLQEGKRGRNDQRKDEEKLKLQKTENTDSSQHALATLSKSSHDEELPKKKCKWLEEIPVIALHERTTRGKEEISNEKKTEENVQIDKINSQVEEIQNCAPPIIMTNGSRNGYWNTVFVREDLQDRPETILYFRLKQTKEHKQIPNKYLDCTCCFKYEKDTSTRLIPYESYIKIYKCPKCTFESKNIEVLQIHRRSIHYTSLDWLPCGCCNFRTPSNLELHKHMDIHSDIFTVNFFKCDLCGFELNTSIDVQNHFFKYHKRKEILLLRILCGMCPHQSKSVKELKVHLLTCHLPEVKPTMYRVVTEKMVIPVSATFCTSVVKVRDVIRIKCAFCCFLSRDRSQVLEHVQINHSLIKIC